MICLQASDKVLWRASDHGPAARIHRVLVPVLQHTMRILEVVLDHHESLNCKQKRDCHYNNVAEGNEEPVTDLFDLRVSHKDDYKESRTNAREYTQNKQDISLFGKEY